MVRPINDQYVGPFVEFMNYLHPDELYDANTVFPMEVLTTIRPHHVVEWMSLKAYGTPHPERNANPIHCRSNSLQRYKTSISSYMVNYTHQWNEVSLSGNPTKSNEVNELINAIKLKEVRREGATNNARRDFEPSEFNAIVNTLYLSNDIKSKFMISAMIKFQFHLIARLDDVSHFLEHDLRPSSHHNFALMAKMSWSKNIRNEAESPLQILLGAMDTRYCVLLALGMYLEVWLGTGNGIGNEFLFGQSESSLTNKRFVYGTLKAIWDHPDFVRAKPGPIGTHSFRKYSATFARRGRCGVDDVEARGRWRTNKVSDRYMNTTLPYADAKVACNLAIGGACKYCLREGTGITDLWLAENVVPNIFASERLKSIALTLALPILWAVFEPALATFVDVAVANRIREAYRFVRNDLEADVNPVKKVLLRVVNADGIAHFLEPRRRRRRRNDEEGEGNREGQDDGEGNGEGQDNGEGVGDVEAGVFNDDENFMTLYVQNAELRREVQEMRDQNVQMENRISHKLRRLDGNVRRMALQPARRRNAVGLPVVAGQIRNNVAENQPPDNPPDDDDDANMNVAAPPPAVLSSNPRTLFVLWDEYQFGVGGRKAARLFTPAERGACKFTYSRRKIVWDKISIMIRQGHTANAAIDRILATHGEDRSVSQLIDSIRRANNENM